MDLDIEQIRNTKSSAIFSSCANYRYILTREWDVMKGKLMFIMLNPSTADQHVNDPTVHRCQERAMRMDFGGFIVCNIFGYKSTDPRELKNCPDPVGEANDRYILEAARIAEKIICAWGTHGLFRNRGKIVRKMLLDCDYDLHCLGINKNGTPKHPLYLPYKARIITYP